MLGLAQQYLGRIGCPSVADSADFRGSRTDYGDAAPERMTSSIL
jgi:hypothetical protein